MNELSGNSSYVDRKPFHNHPSKHRSTTSFIARYSCVHLTSVKPAIKPAADGTRLTEMRLALENLPLHINLPSPQLLCFIVLEH